MLSLKHQLVVGKQQISAYSDERDIVILKETDSKAHLPGLSRRKKFFILAYQHSSCFLFTLAALPYTFPFREL